jgi:quercetin dioxygenase-like cupin family protein
MEKGRKHNITSTTIRRSEFAGAEAVSLLGLVNYQEGSVVSRVVLKREKGNVTIFAFDEGQGLSEHTSPFDARESQSHTHLWGACT